jgi:hypothetical protein
VKLHEHYHNGFLRPAFPILVEGLASFGHPIWFYPSSFTHHYNGMHSIYNAEGARHLPSFRDLDFSLVSKIVNVFPLMLNKRTSRFRMGMQHKTRRGKQWWYHQQTYIETQGEQPSRNWYSNYSLQTYWWDGPQLHPPCIAVTAWRKE